jgi:tetratricopeptide (TPR) repeat protein
MSLVGNILDIAWQNIGVIGSWASLISLILVGYSVIRISKISRLVELEHSKIVDTIQPFDLFFKIQDAMRLLPRQSPYHITSEEERDRILEGFTASQDCLKFYFREIHGLPVRRENIYIEVAQAYWDKNNIDKALEYYKKALARTHEKDQSERIECLYGLRDCYALQGNSAACLAIDKKLMADRPKQTPSTPKERARNAATMTVIFFQKIFHLRAHRRGENLPPDWPMTFGELKELSVIESNPDPKNDC